MNTVEPIFFEWEGEGIETDDNYNQRFPSHEWNSTSDFLFHQAASELCDEISPYTLQEKYAEIVSDEIEPLREVLPFPEKQLRIGQVTSGSGIRQRIFYLRGESVIIPSPRMEGLARIVSNNKSAARDLRGKLISKLDEIADRFHGAGIDILNVYTGEDFTIKNISHPNAEIKIHREESDDFEVQILEELKPLSEAFVNNIRIEFVNYAPDPEFDILFTTGPFSLIQIEVKDYSGSDNEPGQEEAINRPLRKASLLNIDKTFSVIKGVSDETMKELRMNSDLRNNINIVEKNEIVDQIEPLLERAIGPGPGIINVG